MKSLIIHPDDWDVLCKEMEEASLLKSVDQIQPVLGMEIILCEDVEVGEAYVLDADNCKLSLGENSNDLP
jgi:hypothetical protein